MKKVHGHFDFSRKIWMYTIFHDHRIRLSGSHGKKISYSSFEFLPQAEVQDFHPYPLCLKWSSLSSSMHQRHFTHSTVDTVSMALLCFLPSLPIDLLFTLTLSSRGLCKLAWFEIHPICLLFLTGLVAGCFHLTSTP